MSNSDRSQKFAIKSVARSLLAAAATLLVAATPGHAAPGTQGKDYDEKWIEITSGAAVRVTATNYSIGEQRDNASRVVLTVNGRVVDDRTQRQERASASYLIEGNGTYRILAVCSNERSRQETCSITTERQQVEKF